MGMTQLIVRDGQKPSKDQLEEVKTAAQAPITYTEECPPSTKGALAEFAAKSRQLRRNVKHIKPSVAIRLSSDVLNTYKSLGKGYTGIMADILTFAAKDPDFLKSKLY